MPSLAAASATGCASTTHLRLVLFRDHLLCLALDELQDLALILTHNYQTRQRTKNLAPRD